MNPFSTGLFVFENPSFFWCGDGPLAIPPSLSRAQGLDFNRPTHSGQGREEASGIRVKF